MDKVIERLQAIIEDIKPQPVIGDDDSIYLTEYQEGMRSGLQRAILVIVKAKSEGELE